MNEIMPNHKYKISDDEEVTPEILSKIEHLLNFFNETGIKYKNLGVEPDPDFVKNLPKREDAVKHSVKKGYPVKIGYSNTDYYAYIPGQHNTEKWLETVRELYYKEKNGSGRVASIRETTKSWNPMETYDFLNWLRYYEEGTHLKYKTAQLWYENGVPGYFLHVKPDPKKNQSQDESQTSSDMNQANDGSMSQSEKKHIIEKQRSKIVGRLDSAEKLLRTHDGQIFAGKEFESLLETIYQLKKKIQLVNKVSVSTVIYDDMIIREANILTKKGFVKAGELIYSLAQANNPPPAGLGSANKTTLTPASPNPPMQPSGAPGGLPSMGPGMPQNPPESAPNEVSSLVSPKGITEFLENLDTSNMSDKKDTLEVSDELSVSDELDVNDSDNDLLITEAQEIPKPPNDMAVSPIPDVPKKQAPSAPFKDELKNNKVSPSETNQISPVEVRDFDRIIDSAFANIKISDVVSKLEDIAKIFKTREIPRQLSIVDMMLDSLGLATFFPSLSEAINKSLDSNNYVSTRIDDIISQLRGSMKTKDLDLKGTNPIKDSPEVSSLRNNLQTQENKEKERKNTRKEQENKELDVVSPEEQKETPQVDIEDDLRKPIVPRKEGIPPAPPIPK